jgi:hypothetical protein
MKGLRKEVESLDIFNEMISKASSGDYKWKRKDGSWWTNHNGQIVPYHEPTHGVREIHPSPHEIDSEVAKPEEAPKIEAPKEEVKPPHDFDAPVHTLSWDEAIRRYENHPDMKNVETVNLKLADKNRLRTATRERLYLEDLFPEIEAGGELTDEAKKKSYIINALKLKEERGEVIDSKSFRQMQRDEVYRKYAPSAEVLDGLMSGGWIPPSGKINAPSGGWRKLKEKTIKKENLMNTDGAVDREEDTEEEFSRGVVSLMTPENVANILVKRWRSLNDEVVRAAEEIKKRNLPPDFTKGKSREELISTLGEELVTLIDRVVKHTPDRLRMNKKAEALMNKEPGASWF